MLRFIITCLKWVTAYSEGFTNFDETNEAHRPTPSPRPPCAGGFVENRLDGPYCCHNIVHKYCTKLQDGGLRRLRSCCRWFQGRCIRWCNIDDHDENAPTGHTHEEGAEENALISSDTPADFVANEELYEEHEPGHEEVQNDFTDREECTYWPVFKKLFRKCRGGRLYWRGRKLYCVRPYGRAFVIAILKRRWHLRHDDFSRDEFAGVAERQEAIADNNEEMWISDDTPVNSLQDEDLFDWNAPGINEEVANDFTDREECTYWPVFRKLLSKCRGGRLYWRGRKLYCVRPNGRCYVIAVLRRNCRRRWDAHGGIENTFSEPPQVERQEQLTNLGTVSISQDTPSNIVQDDEELYDLNAPQINEEVLSDFTDDEDITHWPIFSKLRGKKCRGGRIFWRGRKLHCARPNGRCFVIAIMKQCWRRKSKLLHSDDGSKFTGNTHSQTNNAWLQDNDNAISGGVLSSDTPADYITNEELFDYDSPGINEEVQHNFHDNEECTYWPVFKRIYSRCRGGRLYLRGRRLVCSRPNRRCFVIALLKRKWRPKVKPCGCRARAENIDNRIQNIDDDEGTIANDFTDDEDVTNKFSRYLNLCGGRGRIYRRGNLICCCIRGARKCRIIVKVPSKCQCKRPCHHDNNLDAAESYLSNRCVAAPVFDQDEAATQQVAYYQPNNQSATLVTSPLGRNLLVPKLLQPSSVMKATATMRRTNGVLGIVQLHMSVNESSNPATVRLTNVDPNLQYALEFGHHKSCGSIYHESRPLTQGLIRGNNVDNLVDLVEPNLITLKGKPVTVTYFKEDGTPDAYACGNLIVLPAAFFKPLKMKAE